MNQIFTHIVVVIKLIFIGTSLGEWVSIGQSHAFVCTYNVKSYPSFSWFIGADNIIFLCEDYGKLSCTPALDQLLEIYDANITLDSKNYTSVLTIKSVAMEHHNTTWYCYVTLASGLGSSSKYSLYVFAPPQTPSCLNAKLIDDVNIEEQCSTETIFPEAICLFYFKTNNTGAAKMNGGLITYQSEPSSTSGYIRTKCTYTISADKLGPGSHVFYVVMYPNITSNITEDMKRSSQYTNPVVIGYPNAVLAKDCQVNDYIKENQNRTCTCYDNSRIFLSTQVTWSNGSARDGQLEFLSKRPSKDNAMYTCSISNKLSLTKQITYQPNITYGPDSAVLYLPKLTFDQCDPNGANMSGTCSVSDSYPDPTVYVYVSNSPAMHQMKITNNDYRFSQVISESGIVYVLCRAVNTIYEEISSEIISSVTVKGPPEAPQISSVSGKTKSLTEGNKLQVTEGKTDIVCESKGGFPLYKNLTLVCGTHVQSNERSETISMTLNISRGMQGMNCTCAVWHESKCLHNFVKVSLKLLQDEESNVGAIIGGVIAAIVGVLIIVALMVFIVKKRSNKLKRQLQEANINKMQNYSNVQVSEEYMNSETHQYERPICTSDRTTHTEDHTPTHFRQHKSKSNFSDTNVLGGFIEPTIRRQETKENKEIKDTTCQDGESGVKQDYHHYEEIDDVNRFTRDASSSKKNGETEQNTSHMNL